MSDQGIRLKARKPQKSVVQLLKEKHQNPTLSQYLAKKTEEDPKKAQVRGEHGETVALK